MTTQIAERATTELDTVELARPARTLRGLRFPVLPGGAWLAQVGGGAGALIGAYLTFGLGVTLIAGGVACAVLGALREAGRI